MHHPELTMAAYKAAIDDGADGFECDVRITKDNQLVLWHDADMQRVAGSGARIADSTLLEIKHNYPEAITLEDLLILARDNKKELAIETKHPVPTGSAVERKVVDLLAQEKPVADIHIMSFSWLAVEKVRMIFATSKAPLHCCMTDLVLLCADLPRRAALVPELPPLGRELNYWRIHAISLCGPLMMPRTCVFARTMVLMC
jgi:glycerophosphoryl diester phosphodiesterase